MDWIGRGICAAFGWVAFGPIGAVVGFIIGYFFDRARATFRAVFDPETRQQIEVTLFNSVFPLMGCMAKADGRVTEDEIHAAEGLMTRMRLTPDMRQEAIRLFKEGSAADYDLHSTLAKFMSVCGAFPDIKQILLVYLISMAIADGHLHDAEIGMLRKVGQQLGYSEDAFEHLLRMSQAQGHFRGAGGGQGGYQGYAQSQSPQEELALAYEAIGVSESSTDAEVKKAYRKLMSQYHPDKLMGQGVPDEMIKVATERTQEVQTAYDMIKESRK